MSRRILAMLLLLSLAFGLVGCGGEKGDDDAEYVLEYLSNGDGSCTVSGPGNFEGGDLVIPKRSPDGDLVTAIGAYAFLSCDIDTLVISDSVEVIGRYAFEDCMSMTEVTLPKNLRIIESFAFSTCSHITELDIPEKTEQIGVAAFFCCIGLDEIYIPESVKYIGTSAFTNTRELSCIYYGGSKDAWKKIDLGEQDIYFESAEIYYEEE